MPSLCAGQKNDTHPIVESDTVDASGCNSAKRKCEPELCVEDFRSGRSAACDKSVYDVLVPQQFQDCITTAQPTTKAVPEKAK